MARPGGLQAAVVAVVGHAPGPVAADWQAVLRQVRLTGSCLIASYTALYMYMRLSKYASHRHHKCLLL